MLYKSQNMYIYVFVCIDVILAFLAHHYVAGSDSSLQPSPQSTLPMSLFSERAYSLQTSCNLFWSTCCWTFWEWAASTANMDKCSKPSTYICLNFKPENQVNNTRVLKSFHCNSWFRFSDCNRDCIARCTNRQVSLEIQVSESGLTVLMSRTERTIWTGWAAGEADQDLNMCMKVWRWGEIVGSSLFRSFSFVNLKVNYKI